MSLWRYLLRGSDEMTMPRTWLEGPLLTAAEAYTRTQLEQGAIVRDVAAMRRAAFWKAREAMSQPKPMPANVAKFRGQR